MVRWFAALAMLAGCSPGGDEGDARHDAAGSEDAAGADADGDRPDDGGTGPDADADADAPDDAPPPHPVCRYECAGNDDCVAIYGAGWVCRDLASPSQPMCLRLCGADDDCRFGGASDPLMVCRAGACAMRACTGADECTWVNASAVCQELDFGTIRTCQRECRIDDDCGTGAPTCPFGKRA